MESDDGIKSVGTVFDEIVAQLFSDFGQPNSTQFTNNSESLENEETVPEDSWYEPLDDNDENGVVIWDLDCGRQGGFLSTPDYSPDEDDSVPNFAYYHGRPGDNGSDEIAENDAIDSNLESGVANTKATYEVSENFDSGATYERGGEYKLDSAAIYKEADVNGSDLAERIPEERILEERIPAESEKTLEGQEAEEAVKIEERNPEPVSSFQIIQNHLPASMLWKCEEIKADFERIAFVIPDWREMNVLDAPFLIMRRINDLTAASHVTFLKTLDGLCLLDEDDRIALVKSGWFELYVLKSISQVDTNGRQWALKDRQEHPKYFDFNDFFYLYGCHILDKYYRIVNYTPSLWRQDIRLILLIGAILVHTPDRPNVKRKDLVRDFQQLFYFRLLWHYLRFLYGSNQVAEEAFLIIRNLIALIRDVAVDMDRAMSSPGLLRWVYIQYASQLTKELIGLDKVTELDAKFLRHAENAAQYGSYNQKTEMSELKQIVAGSAKTDTDEKKL